MNMAVSYNKADVVFGSSITKTIDLGVLSGNVQMFRFGMGMPSFARTLDAEALGLNVSAEGAEAKAALGKVVKDRRLAVTIPEERLRVFREIRNGVRNLLASKSADYPFAPRGVFAIKADLVADVVSEVGKKYADFQKELEALIEALPTIREEMRAKYLAAADAVYSERPDLRLQGREKFGAAYTAFFDKIFPSERVIRGSFGFRFENLGTIRRPVSLLTREEMLKDEVFAAKARVIQDAEVAYREAVLGWVAQAAASVKVGLFRGLYPIVSGIASGASFGKREINAVRNRLEEIERNDIFGDADVADSVAKLRALTDSMREKITATEAEKAKATVKEVFGEVIARLDGLAFDPTSYARLELDGDGDADLSVMADPEIRAEISEKMSALLVGAIAEAAKHDTSVGETAETARARVAKIAGIKRKIDEAEYRNAEEMSAALGASTLDLD